MSDLQSTCEAIGVQALELQRWQDDGTSGSGSDKTDDLESRHAGGDKYDREHNDLVEVVNDRYKVPAGKTMHGSKTYREGLKFVRDLMPKDKGSPAMRAKADVAAERARTANTESPGARSRAAYNLGIHAGALSQLRHNEQNGEPQPKFHYDSSVTRGAR